MCIRDRLYTLGEQKCALYAVIPDNDTTFNFLVSLLYAQAFQVLYYLSLIHIYGIVLFARPALSCRAVCIAENTVTDADVFVSESPLLFQSPAPVSYTHLVMKRSGTSTARRRRWRWQRGKLPERQKDGPEGFLFRGFFCPMKAQRAKAEE